MYLKRFLLILNHVLFPVGLGVLVYKINFDSVLWNLFCNYFPDGLWAYAFTSAIIIIWHKKQNFWLFFITPLTFVLFEIFQYLQKLPGTGDLLDIFTYFIFYFLSLTILNKKNFNFL